jgi:hypothetical protein
LLPLLLFGPSPAELAVTLRDLVYAAFALFVAGATGYVAANLALVATQWLGIGSHWALLVGGIMGVSAFLALDRPSSK